MADQQLKDRKVSRRKRKSSLVLERAGSDDQGFWSTFQSHLIRLELQDHPMWRERTYLYRYFDAQGHLLYVGITKDFFGRDSTRWVLPWRYKATRVTLEMFQNRRMAELAERTAIRDENPIHNRQRLAPVGEPNRYEQWFFVMQKGKMHGCRRIQLDYHKLELRRAEFLPCWSYEFFGKPLEAGNA